jgi:hypothetical protein
MAKSHAKPRNGPDASSKTFFDAGTDGDRLAIVESGAHRAFTGPVRWADPPDPLQTDEERVMTTWQTCRNGAPREPSGLGAAGATPRRSLGYRLHRSRKRKGPGNAGEFMLIHKASSTVLLGVGYTANVHGTGADVAKTTDGLASLSASISYHARHSCPTDRVQAGCSVGATRTSYSATSRRRRHRQPPRPDLVQDPSAPGRSMRPEDRL